MLTSSRPAPLLTPSDLAAVSRFDPTPTRGKQAAAVLVAAGSRFLMQVLNRVEVHGRHRLEQARAAQAEGRGLLTFSNHVGLFDDPWLLACFAGPGWQGLRWMPADAHNFFGTPLKARVFNAGKAVPLVRGAGLEQPGMEFLRERLSRGDWVHLFPEGGRSRDPEGRLCTPFKGGLAHLIQVARPLVLPFHHQGMHRVLPVGARVPRIGQRVVVRFGAVLASDQELADQAPQAITAWAERELLQLQARATEAG